MRTTLDIDDDVLAAAKELAQLNGKTAGQTVSDLLRRALSGSDPGRLGAIDGLTPMPGGFRPFATRGSPVTNTAVNAIRDAEGS